MLLISEFNCLVKNILRPLTATIQYGVTQHSLSDYTAALESAKRALDIRIKFFGEEHSETAESYHLVGIIQHSLSDYTAAFESAKRDFDIRTKLFGEEHSETAESY